MHAVGVPTNTLAWHSKHAVVICAPCNGNAVLLWSNEAVHPGPVLWHEAQSVEKPAVEWFGLTVLVKSSIWHDEQTGDASENVPVVWQ